MSATLLPPGCFAFRVRIAFTATGPGHVPPDVDGWARNMTPLAPFQLLLDPGTPAQQNTLIAYSGLGPTGWTVSYSDPFGGWPPVNLTFDAGSGDFVALGVVPGVGPYTADVRWTPTALCSEQVVRSKSLSQPNVLEGYDEVIPATGEVLVYDQPSYPPPGLRAAAVTGRGLVWVSGHARGYVHKVNSRTPNRLAGQSLTYVPL